MAKENLLDDHVSVKQCKLAVNALLDHAVKVQEKQQANELLPGKEQNVWLVVTTKQMQPEQKLKPAKIPIVHPLVDPRTSPVCLITKDPQREYKDLLETNGIRFINRVVGITKLKGKFKPYEARRLLLKENGLFLADERVVPLLPGLLGKKFFDAKKQPIPVCLTRKDLKGELERAISSTYFHQNKGTCASVKIGTVSQTPSQVLANLQAALPAIVKHIKGEWDNMQSLHIKTNSSVSLPIWSCELGSEPGGRWDGLIAVDEVSGSDSGSDDAANSEDDVSMDVDKDILPPAKGGRGEDRKGKKRSADAEVELPKKKAKKDASQVSPHAEKLQKVAKTGSATMSQNKASIAVSTTVKASKKRQSITDTLVTESVIATAKAVLPIPDLVESSEAGLTKKKRRKSEKTSSLVSNPAPSVILLSESSIAPEAPVVTAIESVPSQEHAKKKRRKSAAVVDPALSASPTPTSSILATAPTGATNTSAVAAEPSSAPSEHVVPASEKKLKRRHKSRLSAVANGDPVPEASIPGAVQATEQLVAPAVAPTTPVPSHRKKPRAAALDFFNEDVQSTPTTVVPPPNTPADGLTQSPSEPTKKRKAKTTEGTPVSKAIVRLTNETVVPTPKTDEATSTGQAADASGKKTRRKRKSQEGGATELQPADAPSSAATVQPVVAAGLATDTALNTPASSRKPRKRKTQNADVPAESTPAAPRAADVPAAPTKEELKLKRSASGVEKKKDRSTKKKSTEQSAKDTLLGKKGL